MGQGGERSNTGSIVTEYNTAASENNRCQNWGLIVVSPKRQGTESLGIYLYSIFPLSLIKSVLLKMTKAPPYGRLL